MKKRKLISRLKQAIDRLESFNENPHEPHDKYAAQAVEAKRAELLQIVRIWRKRQDGYADANNAGHREHVYAATLLQWLEVELKETT